MLQGRNTKLVGDMDLYCLPIMFEGRNLGDGLREVTSQPFHALSAEFH